jgi:hypothetical protein
MPKNQKSKRSKTKAKTKTTSTKKPKSRSKTEKKAKMETTKLRLSKPLKTADSFNSKTLEKPTKQVRVAEIKTQPEQLKANVSLINNFRLEVDGRLKSEYPTAEAATKAGLELKQKYPQIQVKVFDAKERTRTVMELPE